MLLGLFRRKLLIHRESLKPDFLQVKQPLRLKKLLQTKHLFKMNEAFVRYNKENDRFDISFRYVNPDLLIDRQYNFNRMVGEPIETFLKRIDVNVSKTLNNKKRRKKKKEQRQNSSEEIATEEETVDNVAADKIRILKKNEKIDNSVICKEILEEPSEVILDIFGVKYTLNVNSPWVESINLPVVIMAGFLVYPHKFETLYTNQKDSIFTWYRENKKKLTNDTDYWQKVGEEFIYVPSNEDIGLKLKLICEPKCGDRSGPTSEVISSCLVQAGPGLCPFEIRQAFTKEKLSGKNFRVVTYNLLANAYADSNFSRENLFQYCPLYALEIDYRKQLFIKEITGYNSDIVCLQEVDARIFENDLLPTLSSLNYDGMYTKKGEELSEGLAVFYNSERFEKLHSDIIVMSQNTDMEPFSETWSKITNEKTKERFLARNTTMQAIALKSKENVDNIFVVGNTHLYFHPDADHIRLLQGYFALAYVQNVMKKIKEQYPDCKVHMVLCGDFNSVPECGIYKLYTQNHVPDNFIDWSSNEEEKVENISLSQNYKIASACGTPKYTNYTVGFNGCLDYIFYEANYLKVSQVIPMPSDEEVKLHEAIPSVVFPSDHISLCADLELIS